MSSSRGAAAVNTHSAGKAAAERGKERAGLFSPPDRRQKETAASAALPDWKLGCLMTEYGLPPNVRRTLQLSGCF